MQTGNDLFGDRQILAMNCAGLRCDNGPRELAERGAHQAFVLVDEVRSEFTIAGLEFHANGLRLGPAEGRRDPVRAAWQPQILSDRAQAPRDAGDCLDTVVAGQFLRQPVTAARGVVEGRLRRGQFGAGERKFVHGHLALVQALVVQPAANSTIARERRGQFAAATGRKRDQVLHSVWLGGHGGLQGEPIIAASARCNRYVCSRINLIQEERRGVPGRGSDRTADVSIIRRANVPRLRRTPAGALTHFNSLLFPGADNRARSAAH